MSKLACVACCLALLSIGCSSGTETGNPPAGAVSLGLTAFTSAPAAAALTTGQGGLAIDRVAFNVASLTLAPCATGAAELTLAAGPYDLTSAPSSRLMGSLPLCSLRLALAPAKAASQDVPAGVALYLHGLRTDGSQFDVESASPRSIELRAAAGSSFGEGPLLLGFDVGLWLDGVDVHGAHAGADGIARLDATLNPALLSELEAKAADSLRLYVDADADGMLDESERTPVASP